MEHESKPVQKTKVTGGDVVILVIVLFALAAYFGGEDVIKYPIGFLILIWPYLKWILAIGGLVLVLRAILEFLAERIAYHMSKHKE